MAFQGDNMMGVKRNNRAAVLQLLHNNGGMSRKRLAESMNLTAAAITKIVGEMQGEGLLREGETLATGNAGRREVLIEINPEYSIALGVLINVRQLVVSAVRLDGSLIFRESRSLALSAPAEPTLQEIAAMLEQNIAAYRIHRDKIIGIGIAIRGHISCDGRGSADSYGALLEKDYPICERLEALTGFPTVLDNNVRALHAAQRFLSHETAAGGAQFFLRCEYGIGSSIVIDGKLWRGVRQSCGEIGHIPVVRKGGKRCVCGRRGCLETVASPDSICESVLDIYSPEQTPVLWHLCDDGKAPAPGLTEIFRAFDENDPGVKVVVEHAVTELRAALETVARLLDPDSIILYGRLFEKSGFLSRFLEQETDAPEHVRIEKSKFNCRLEDIAACLLAVNRFYLDGGLH